MAEVMSCCFCVASGSVTWMLLKVSARILAFSTSVRGVSEVLKVGIGDRVVLSSFIIFQRVLSVGLRDCICVNHFAFLYVLIFRFISAVSLFFFQFCKPLLSGCLVRFR